MAAISPNPQPSTLSEVKTFVVKWTPRTVVAACVGYYSLGVAYQFGLMAAIDKLAIPIIGHFLGYGGVGAAMPMFQWYSAWAVRMTAALIGACIYDLAERATFCFAHKVRDKFQEARSNPERV